MNYSTNTLAPSMTTVVFSHNTKTTDKWSLKQWLSQYMLTLRWQTGSWPSSGCNVDTYYPTSTLLQPSCKQDNVPRLNTKTIQEWFEDHEKRAQGLNLASKIPDTVEHPWYVRPHPRRQTKKKFEVKDLLPVSVASYHQLPSEVPLHALTGQPFGRWL